MGKYMEHSLGKVDFDVLEKRKGRVTLVIWSQ